MGRVHATRTGKRTFIVARRRVLVVAVPNERRPTAGQRHATGVSLAVRQLVIKPSARQREKRAAERDLRRSGREVAGVERQPHVKHGSENDAHDAERNDLPLTESKEATQHQVHDRRARAAWSRHGNFENDAGIEDGQRVQHEDDTCNPRAQCEILSGILLPRRDGTGRGKFRDWRAIGRGLFGGSRIQIPAAAGAVSILALAVAKPAMRTSNEVHGCLGKVVV